MSELQWDKAVLDFALDWLMERGGMVCCYMCHSDKGDDSNWVGCEMYSGWGHIKCVHLTGIKMDNVKKVN